MISKIKAKILSLSAVLLFAVPLAVPALANAQGADVQNDVCTGAQTLQFGATQACDTNTTENSLNGTITSVINILSIIVGVIAVIMIIFGGFRYVTSGGDTTKVSSAKTTILYALIGLVIVAIAQVIVKFVIGKATNIQ